jgi:hypothetical protein
MESLLAYNRSINKLMVVHDLGFCHGMNEVAILLNSYAA